MQTTAAPTTVAVGGTIAYTQVVSNTSGATINPPITVTQNIPPNTTLVSAAKTAGHHNWTCTNTATTITCTDTSGTGYGSGGADNTTFTVVVTVNAGTPNGTVITDTVTAKGNNTTAVSATANVTVQIPDLSVTDADAPDPVSPSSNNTYTQVVTNNGSVPASGVTLTGPRRLIPPFNPSLPPPDGLAAHSQPSAALGPSRAPQLER